MRTFFTGACWLGGVVSLFLHAWVLALVLLLVSGLVMTGILFPMPLRPAVSNDKTIRNPSDVGF